MAESRKIALVAGSILLAAALVLGGQFLIRERSKKQISVIVPDLSAEAKNGKIAFETRILIARIDPASGQLSLDEGFRDKGASAPGVSFDRPSWPHGATGKAIPHGAVFSRPSN